MNSTILRIISLVSLGLAPLANAGTVSSGGGLLYRYTNNPWWIENTKTVSYCLEVDDQAFDLGVDGLGKMVEEVLGEWIAAFDLNRTERYYEDGELAPYKQLNIATQKFVKGACTPTTDLVFQFGTLHEDQLKYFSKANDFVGAAVRAEYDLETLKSTGFIYIAPLVGPLKPNAEFLAPDAFSKTVCDGCLLKTVLRHEVAHIFGMRHQESDNSVMNERLPEWLVDELYVNMVKSGKVTKDAFLNHFAPARTLQSYIPERTIEGCGDYSPSMHNSFFGVPENFQCFRFQISKDGRTGMLRVLAAEKEGDSYKEFGSAIIGNNSTSSQPMIHLDVPQEQKVFTKLPTDRLERRTLFGAVYSYEQAGDATYRSSDRTVNNLMVLRYKPLGVIEAIGIKDGLVDDLFSPGFLD